MRSVRFVLSVLAFAVMSSVAVQARVVTQIGGCSNGNTWLVIITISDKTGRVTGMEGVNCAGSFWKVHCTLAPISNAPTDPGEYGDIVDNGAWFRYNVNTEGMVADMWGFDPLEGYWQLVDAPLE